MFYQPFGFNHTKPPHTHWSFVWPLWIGVSLSTASSQIRHWINTSVWRLSKVITSLCDKRASVSVCQSEGTGSAGLDVRTYRLSPQKMDWRHSLNNETINEQPTGSPNTHKNLIELKKPIASLSTQFTSYEDVPAVWLSGWHDYETADRLAKCTIMSSCCFPVPLNLCACSQCHPSGNSQRIICRSWLAFITHQTFVNWSINSCVPWTQRFQH